MLDTGPEQKPRSRVVLLTVLGLALGGGLLVAGELPDEPDRPPDCRQEQDAAWCTTPSETLTDEAIVRLVRGYCPRLRSLPLAEVVPQPLRRVGLPARPDELVLRTTGSGAVLESGLLGRPSRLAWVVHRSPGDQPWQLQVVCRDGAVQLPVLELDGGQLRSALRVDQGRRGLDLREAARRTARAVRATQGTRMSLGTFRCRTTARELALGAGETFACSLPLRSTLGQAVHRVRFAVQQEPPHLRRVS